MTAEVEDGRRGVEALRAEFEEVAVAALGTDGAAGLAGGFEDLSIEAGFAQGVGAGEAGDSGADDQNGDVGGHGVCEPSYHFVLRREFVQRSGADSRQLVADSLRGGEVEEFKVGGGLAGA